MQNVKILSRPPKFFTECAQGMHFGPNSAEVSGFCTLCR
jgi:hypothetical protein